jgi:hypothetical protein
MTISQYQELDEHQRMRAFFIAEKVNLIMKDQFLLECRRYGDFYIVMKTDGHSLEISAQSEYPVQVN